MLIFFLCFFSFSWFAYFILCFMYCFLFMSWFFFVPVLISAHLERFVVSRMQEFYHSLCLKRNPWSCSHPLRAWLTSHWTDKNRHICNGMQLCAVVLTVWNCLQLSWQSATVCSCLDSLKLSWQCETVCSCLDSMKLSWQSANVLTIWNCLEFWASFDLLDMRTLQNN